MGDILLVLVLLSRVFVVVFVWIVIVEVDPGGDGLVDSVVVLIVPAEEPEGSAGVVAAALVVAVIRCAAITSNGNVRTVLSIAANAARSKRVVGGSVLLLS